MIDPGSLVQVADLCVAGSLWMQWVIRAAILNGGGGAVSDVSVSTYEPWAHDEMADTASVPEVSVISAEDPLF